MGIDSNARGAGAARAPRRRNRKRGVIAAVVVLGSLALSACGLEYTADGLAIACYRTDYAYNAATDTYVGVTPGCTTFPGVAASWPHYIPIG